MKITKNYLKQLIKEELSIMNEGTPEGSYVTGAMPDLADFLKKYHDLYNLIYRSYSQRREQTRGSKLVGQQAGITKQIIDNIFKMKKIADSISSFYRSHPELKQRSNVNTMQFAFADKMLNFSSLIADFLQKEQNLKNGKLVNQKNLDLFMNQTHNVFMEILKLAKDYKQKMFMTALGERP